MNTIHVWAYGIDRYQHLQNLEFCVNDAELFADTVGQFSNSQPPNVFRAPRIGGDAMGYLSMLAELDTIRASDFGASDTVFFYFAGHGLTVDGADFLVLPDSDPATVGTNAENCIRVQSIVEALRASGAGLAVIFLDACRGTVRGWTERFGVDLRERAKKQGIVSVLGCQEGDYCHEHPALEHGVFSFCMCKRIRDKHELVPVLDQQPLLELMESTCLELGIPVQVPDVVISRLDVANVDLISGRRKQLVPGRKRLLLIAGPAYTGKSTVGPKAAQLLGFTQVEMSSYAYKRWNEARETGAYGDSIQKFMDDVIWKENSADVIARDLLESNDGVSQLVVCGPRRTEEVETFLGAGFDVEVVYLYTTSRERYKRHLTRAGELFTQPATLEEFVHRDLTEYSWGLSEIGLMRRTGFQENMDGQADAAAEAIVRDVGARWPADT